MAEAVGARPRCQTARVAVALVFPGQGSQRPGMGAPWRTRAEWELVERAAAVLDHDCAGLLLDADAGTLKRPWAAQVATLLASLLALRALADRHEVIAVAGHSLGEFTALVAAGVLTEDDALRLVGERGAAMQDAADARPGTMAAVLGADDEVVEAACAEVDEAWPANYNAPQHVVISGTAQGLAAAGERLKQAAARRVLPIPVGGAYHTPLMAPAQPRLAAALAATTFHPALIPVVTNVDGRANTDGFAARLERQLVEPVRWAASQRALAVLGVSELIEVGPGGVLAGLAKRTVPQLRVRTVAGPDDLAGP